MLILCQLLHVFSTLYSIFMHFLGLTPSTALLSVSCRDCPLAQGTYHSHPRDRLAAGDVRLWTVLAAMLMLRVAPTGVVAMRVVETRRFLLLLAPPSSPLVAPLAVFCTLLPLVAGTCGSL